jgi:hypothetical protein
MSGRVASELTFGIACPSGQYSRSQYSRDDWSLEAIMAKHSGIHQDPAGRMWAIEKPYGGWSAGIKQACDFVVARAGWVWLILTISLIAGVLSTT